MSSFCTRVHNVKSVRVHNHKTFALSKQRATPFYYCEVTVTDKDGNSVTLELFAGDPADLVVNAELLQAVIGGAT